MDRMLSSYNNVVSRILAHYAGERKRERNKQEEGSKKKIREDLMNGEMMGVEGRGILKFRPTGEYRDTQNKS
jgi:hypothetical protein